jgi:acarbose 7IV-phosphotransferase
LAIGLRLPQVLVIGGASWNTIIRVVRFPDPGPATVSPASWHDAVGSSGAGKALNLVRLGAEVTLVAALGDDEAGERVAATVTSAGIRLIRVRDPAGTSRHLNLMDSAGRRISFQMQGATIPDLDFAAVERAMSSADLVYLGVAGFTRSLAPLASRHGRSVWTDLHGYDGANPDREEFIEVAQIILFSGERLPDPRHTMEQLRGRGKRLVVCTLAERGALALTGSGRWIEVAAEAADVVDTNGAGDAFAAGLMVASFLGVPLGEALAVEARSAAISVGSGELAAPDLSLERVLPGGQ